MECSLARHSVRESDLASAIMLAAPQESPKGSLLYPFLIMSALGLVFGCVVDIAHVFEFGGDEGFELQKSFMVYHGYKLYSQIWNDQPPLHTLAVAAIFKVFGVSTVAARSLSIVLSAGLGTLLYDMVRREVGAIGGLACLLFLLAWRSYLELSASVMLELPAMFMGVASLWMMYRPATRARGIFLFAAGFLFGLALQTKLTAIIFGPAVVLKLIGSGLDEQKASGDRVRIFKRMFVNRLLAWALGGAAGFLLVWLVFQEGKPLEMMFRSHFTYNGAGAEVEARQSEFTWEHLQPNAPWVVVAAIGVVCIFWTRTFRLLPVVVLLVTVFAIHWHHRPYWAYYTLHFAIPVCWAAGIGAAFAMQFLRERPLRSALARNSVRVIGACCVSVMGALACVCVQENVSDMRHLPKLIEIPMVSVLRSNAADSNFIFTDSPIYAFHSRALLQPGVAVLPAKRFWSGQITASEVVEVVKRGGASQIALFNPRLRSAFARSRPDGFMKIEMDADCDYYLRAPGQSP